jgi:hypothetical protein
MDDDQEYFVWNRFHGVGDAAKIETIEQAKHGHKARMAEPFGSKMGWFSYEDLIRAGRAESQGFTVYTWERWQADRHSEMERHSKRKFTTWPEADNVEHRKVLGLPASGPLLTAEIERACRRLAKQAHPDAGGTSEEFRRLIIARDALIKLHGR